MLLSSLKFSEDFFRNAYVQYIEYKHTRTHKRTHSHTKTIKTLALCPLQGRVTDVLYRKKETNLVGFIESFLNQESKLSTTTGIEVFNFFKFFKIYIVFLFLKASRRVLVHS